jgi:hypothetical protein
LKRYDIPFPQLSTSNIFVDENNVCRLSDLENSFLGVPSHYQKINSKLVIKNIKKRLIMIFYVLDV